MDDARKPRPPKIPPKDYIDAVDVPREVTMRPIGWVRSPFTERFGTPRQARRTPPGNDPLGQESLDARVELWPDRVQPEALRHLEQFDHLWLVTWFHLNGPLRKPMVRPPRGGPLRGVLATRAPHRPNPIGLSAVELLRVEGRVLHVRGVDLLDRTPVLDLKPYISDYDAIPDASRGWLTPPEP